MSAMQRGMKPHISWQQRGGKRSSGGYCYVKYPCWRAHYIVLKTTEYFTAYLPGLPPLEELRLNCTADFSQSNTPTEHTPQTNSQQRSGHETVTVLHHLISGTWHLIYCGSPYFCSVNSVGLPVEPRLVGLENILHQDKQDYTASQGSRPLHRWSTRILLLSLTAEGTYQQRSAKAVVECHSLARLGGGRRTQRERDRKRRRKKHHVG